MAGCFFVVCQFLTNMRRARHSVKPVVLLFCLSFLYIPVPLIVTHQLETDNKTIAVFKNNFPHLKFIFWSLLSVAENLFSEGEFPSACTDLNLDIEIIHPLQLVESHWNRLIVVQFKLSCFSLKLTKSTCSQLQVITNACNCR